MMKDRKGVEGRFGVPAGKNARPGRLKSSLGGQSGRSRSDSAEKAMGGEEVRRGHWVHDAEAWHRCRTHRIILSRREFVVAAINLQW